MSELTDGAYQPTVLVVDDEPHLQITVRRFLERAGCLTVGASSGEEALAELECGQFDLAVLDIMMPGMSGVELAERITTGYPATAVIMATAVDDPEVARQALEVGAYGYMVKPFTSNELRIHAFNALRRRELEERQRRHREELERTVAERTADLRQAVTELERAEVDLRDSREDTIQRLARAAEFRDNETAQHTQRMSHYCHLIARQDDRAPDYCDLLRLASTLHDVGKIGIPDQILLKPGRYTDEEFEVMKRHAEIGARILDGSNSPLVRFGARIALTHHERVDGSGYPRGLKGADIPYEGRVAAIADVFDALTTKRVYKDAIPVDQALNMLVDGRGKHFEAKLLDLFCNARDQIQEIRATHHDGGGV